MQNVYIVHFHVKVNRFVAQNILNVPALPESMCKTCNLTRNCIFISDKELKPLLCLGMLDIFQSKFAVQGLLCSVKCLLCVTYGAVCSVQCAVYIVQPVVCIFHFVVCSVHWTVSKVQLAVSQWEVCRVLSQSVL